jgi:phosphoglycerate dehydrogenase-like enzyme
MKKSAVFMNIGRGVTVKESDLVKALNEKMISGAVLDVFEKEPLTEQSEIWECENVLITPHCADQDTEHI